MFRIIRRFLIDTISCGTPDIYFQNVCLCFLVHVFDRFVNYFMVCLAKMFYSKTQTRLRWREQSYLQLITLVAMETFSNTNIVQAAYFVYNTKLYFINSYSVKYNE